MKCHNRNSLLSPFFSFIFIIVLPKVKLCNVIVIALLFVRYIEFHQFVNTEKIIVCMLYCSLPLYQYGKVSLKMQLSFLLVCPRNIINEMVGYSYFLSMSFGSITSGQFIYFRLKQYFFSIGIRFL